jgi:hypothetical protein
MIAFSKKVDLGTLLETRYTGFNVNDTDLKMDTDVTHNKIATIRSTQDINQSLTLSDLTFAKIRR